MNELSDSRVSWLSQDQTHTGPGEAAQRVGASPSTYLAKSERPDPAMGGSARADFRYTGSPPHTPTKRSAGSTRAIDSKSRSSCRSEEHKSELQSLMRISYAVFCLKKKNKQP